MSALDEARARIADLRLELELLHNRTTPRIVVPRDRVTHMLLLCDLTTALLRGAQPAAQPHGERQ